MSVGILQRTAATVIASMLVAYLALPSARGQRAADVPEELNEVGITQQVDAQLPLDTEFVDEDGRPVRLGDFFGERPVILTLNYYTCPMLCTLQLNGLVETIKQLDWVPGDEFEIVTVSFDPVDTPRIAKTKKQNYVNEYGRAEAARGWHFLTGKKASIKRLTEAVGFAYKWNEAQKQWAHSAALILCTPKGRVSRYIGGVMYDSKTLRLSLVEASEGKVGSLWDSAFLWCYHYDATDGRYNVMVTGIMRVGGVGTLLVLGVVLLVFWRREARRRKKPAVGAAT